MGSRCTNHMSRYEIPGRESRYRLTVGWDNTVPLLAPVPGTLFLQVADVEGLVGPQEDAAEVEVGDTPEEGLVVWIGQGVDDVISDVSTIVAAAAPYGDIPLPTQLDLLRDMDRDWPRPWQTVGTAVAAIVRQSPLARLASAPQPGHSSYLLLDERGWQVGEWQDLLGRGDDYERTFAGMVFKSEAERKEYGYLDPLASYVSDPSIIFRVHPSGLSLGLPVFAALERGVMLAGPVVIAGEDGGLSDRQVQLIASEVLCVEESLRAGVSALWRHVWSTIGARAEE